MSDKVWTGARCCHIVAGVNSPWKLLAQLPELYGSPFFDILLLDSLYAQAPLLRVAGQIGWDVVITLKQEKRELYQNAQRLFPSRPPDPRFQETHGTGSTEVQL